MEVNEKIQSLRKQAMVLPLHPGVYIMKDASNKVIYVGKAKKLKNRVSQYFGSDTNHTEKVRQMVRHVDHFETILADSEFEALVLECSLIKQYAPKYNILLKDDKGFSYIRISPPPYSRLSEAKQIADDGAKYIGPYMSSFAVKKAVDEANKAFGLATCERTFSYKKKGLKTERPCLNFHIGQCCGPCTGKISETEYAERVEGAIRLLKEGAAPIVRNLEERMNQAADDLDFEKAAELRDRIAAIKRIGSRQKVIMSGNEDQDVIAIAIGKDKSCVQVFRFTEGKLTDKEEFILETPDNLSEMRSEFLQRYYDMRNPIPKKVLVDGEVEDAELLETWLKSKANHSVKLIVPQKGEQAKLVLMCSRNAAENLARVEGMYGHDATALDELSKLLNLSKTPGYIECYDISHTAGEDAVAGMVVFEDGRPLKKAYRKFKIQEATGGDDPGAMREVLSRRLNELVIHEGEEGFGRKPDLIFLDGGKAQVDAVAPIIDAFGFDIPVFGLVKDSHHRTRAISSTGGEVAIQSKRTVFTLLSSIQEEVHRYAIGYHRKTRGKNTILTELTKIDGVGAKRATILLKQFGSVKAVQNASKEELLRIKGITDPVAEAIVNYFNRKE